LNTSARKTLGAPQLLEQASSENQASSASLRDEDQRIMTLAASMDPVAQRAVALRLFGRVSRLVRMLLRDSTDAEDATQLSLLEILRSAGGYRGESSLEHWADRIAVRTALRYARKRRESESHLDPDANLDEIHERESPRDDPDARRAERLLSQLSPALREVVVLRHVMGHSVAESARELGVSPNTVKDRLVRAREKLRSLVRREAFLNDARTREP
jgi:RNA polymerase sigma-70 factor (ECF subfamily)